MSFIQIEEQIERELLCIDDLTAEIRMLARKGQTNILKQLERDLQNSLKQLEKLHRQKELWATVDYLNQQGKLSKVVNEIAHQA